MPAHFQTRISEMTVLEWRKNRELSLVLFRSQQMKDLDSLRKYKKNNLENRVILASTRFHEREVKCNSIS